MPLHRKPLAEEIKALIESRRFGSTFESDLSDLIWEWSHKASGEAMLRVLKAATNRLENEDEVAA